MQNRVRAALVQAVSEAVNAVPGDLAAGISKDLDAFLASLIPAAPGPDVDCPNVDPSIAPFCAQRQLDFATAAHDSQSAEIASTSDLESAIGEWKLALSTYDFEVTNADLTLRSTVKAAVDTYSAKLNPDSFSRNQFLFYAMKADVATALQAYESSMASAGDTLAGAAGTLLSALTAYLTSIQTAKVTRQAAEATALQNFWQCVEQVRDSE